MSTQHFPAVVTMPPPPAVERTIGPENSPLTKLTFPSEALVGSLGELARELARGSEVPEEFYFASALTLLGAKCGTDVRLDISFNAEPRLYTVLLGDSYGAKKSTAMKKTIEFFEKVRGPKEPHIVYGVGSAEGLARTLQSQPNVVIAFDELRAFVDKTKVQGSVLLPMVTGLFEQNKWENVTKNAKHSMRVTDGHVSLIGCCTTATYSDMWTTEAISIGFPNRLFVVNGDRNGKVAWPLPADDAKLEELRVKIGQQLARLPLTLSITPEAKAAWECWYINLPSSEHTRRLDTIGFRLLGLIALTTNKVFIDVETVRTVTAILNYELTIRMVTDPIDADSNISKLEEKIRRSLVARGALSARDLRRVTHADRIGLWAFEAATKNLENAGDISKKGGVYRLAHVGE
jgi:hypothetical protein